MNEFDQRHYRFARRMDRKMADLPWAEQVRVGDRLADALVGVAVACLLIWLFV